MFIKIKKPWDNVKHATEEDVYLGRRSFLKDTARYGIVAGLMLSGADTLAGISPALAKLSTPPAGHPLSSHEKITTPPPLPRRAKPLVHP